MPGRPAVLLLHWWSPYINRHAFYFSSEDGINTVAAYYGVLCVGGAMMRPHCRASRIRRFSFAHISGVEAARGLPYHSAGKSEMVWMLRSVTLTKRQRHAGRPDAQAPPARQSVRMCTHDCSVGVPQL